MPKKSKKTKISGRRRKSKVSEAELRDKLAQLGAVRMTLANVRQTQTLLTQAMSDAEKRVQENIARLEAGEDVDVRSVISAGFDCLGTAGTAGTFGGTLGSFGTFGSFGDDDSDDDGPGPQGSVVIAMSGKTPIE